MALGGLSHQANAYRALVHQVGIFLNLCTIRVGVKYNWSSTQVLQVLVIKYKYKYKYFEFSPIKYSSTSSTDKYKYKYQVQVRV